MTILTIGPLEDLPTGETWHFVELPSLRSVALKYKIWWQFKPLKY